MISAIKIVSIRKKIPSFLTVPLGRIIRIIHCEMLSILSNKAVTGYFVVAEGSYRRLKSVASFLIIAFLSMPGKVLASSRLSLD
jgi:hypothetical protein